MSEDTNIIKNIDLHALDYYANPKDVVSIAAEHGFRGIVTTQGMIDKYSKLINRSGVGDKNIIPICAIDFPFGSLSTDVRTYSILAAKEKGAKEVEIVAPYHLFCRQYLPDIKKDLDNLVYMAKKVEITLKYVIDGNSMFMSDYVQKRVIDMLTKVTPDYVSTSLGFYDDFEGYSHEDSILFSRTLHKKYKLNVKMYGRNVNSEYLNLYKKAGVSIIGLDWNKAVYAAYDYNHSNK